MRKVCSQWHPHQLQNKIFLAMKLSKCKLLNNNFLKTVMNFSVQNINVFLVSIAINERLRICGTGGLVSGRN